MSQFCQGLGGLLLVLIFAAKGAGAAEIVATVVDDDGEAIRHAVIHAEPAAGAAPNGAPTETVIDQIDKLCTPFVSVVRAGTRIRFPNRDNIKHHVYSFSRAKKFELPLYAGRAAAPVLFDKPGEVTMGCNIHDWMIAHVLVVDTPHFAVTGDDGQARLGGLPPGDYRVRVWHPGMKGKRKAKPQGVRLGDGNAELRFEIRLKSRHKWWREKPDDADERYERNDG